jgi:hypothetical protein
VVSTRTEGLKTLSRDYDFFPDPSTIHKWRNEKQEFSEMYARAKLQQADILAEECLQIADDCDGSNFAKARLQIDTRKWLASKLLPKQYGDRGVSDQNTESNDEVIREMKELRANLDKQNRKDY